MSGWLGGVLAAHVIAVISWMAGLLYMPRLFVYHCQVPAGSDQSALFKVMERRLLHAITIPAAAVSWALGLVLVTQVGLAGNGWLHGKLALVAGLTLFTGWLEKWRRAFAVDNNPHSQKFYRIANELPTLLMIGIVVLVVMKPF
jgi:putative membrane protein